MNPTADRQPYARTRRAFTLIEILIVIALSAVLFALLLVPLVNGIKYARQAQSLTAAQDAARITRERIERELGSAVYVFDNTSHPFQLAAGKSYAAGDDQFTNFLDLDVPLKPDTSVGGSYATAVAHAYNAKLDFVLPKLNDKGNPIDPTTQEPISIGTSGTTSSPIISDPSQIFPAAAGTTMVRCWVGLKDPSAALQQHARGDDRHVSTDNTYVLYRAQCRLSNDLDPATEQAGCQSRTGPPSTRNCSSRSTTWPVTLSMSRNWMTPTSSATSTGPVRRPT